MINNYELENKLFAVCRDNNSEIRFYRSKKGLKTYWNFTNNALYILLTEEYYNKISGYDHFIEQYRKIDKKLRLLSVISFLTTIILLYYIFNKIPLMLMNYIGGNKSFCIQIMLIILVAVLMISPLVYLGYRFIKRKIYYIFIKDIILLLVHDVELRKDIVDNIYADCKWFFKFYHVQRSVLVFLINTKIYFIGLVMVVVICYLFPNSGVLYDSLFNEYNYYETQMLNETKSKGYEIDYDILHTRYIYDYVIENDDIMVYGSYFQCNDYICFEDFNNNLTVYNDDFDIVNQFKDTTDIVSFITTNNYVIESSTYVLENGTHFQVIIYDYLGNELNNIDYGEESIFYFNAIESNNQIILSGLLSGEDGNNQGIVTVIENNVIDSHYYYGTSIITNISQIDDQYIFVVFGEDIIQVTSEFEYINSVAIDNWERLVFTNETYFVILDENNLSDWYYNYTIYNNDLNVVDTFDLNYYQVSSYSQMNGNTNESFYYGNNINSFTLLDEEFNITDYGLIVGDEIDFYEDNTIYVDKDTVYVIEDGVAYVFIKQTDFIRTFKYLDEYQNQLLYLFVSYMIVVSAMYIPVYNEKRKTDSIQH